MIDGEFRAACEQLKPLIKQARTLSPHLAAEQLALHNRFETILLMPRAGGKTTVGLASKFGSDGPIQQSGGWLDDGGHFTDNEMARLIMGMLKLKREQRSTLPDYNPKITLRPETWHRLQPSFHWLHSSHVAQIEFPKSVFYQALLKVGATPDALAHFPRAWLERSCDCSGRLLPGLAFDVLERTVDLHLAGLSASYAIWRGYAEAAAAHVKAQTDLCYWLAYMAAGDAQVYTRGRKFTLLRERALLRIRQARKCTNERLPHGLSAPQFIKHCEVAGVWKPTSRGYLAFSTPYAIGTHFLKASLTDAAFQRMLSP